jgi:hypothetical protein
VPPVHPVAVELFTSQGCSSCPPADAVQAKFAADPGIVAITRPVTYWDRLGWKDTLARPANTELQPAYAARKLPGAGVYTPGMVVQGRAGAVGSREALVRTLIARAARLLEPDWQITPRYGGRQIVVNAPPRVQLVLIGLKSSVTVPIGSGENGGRRVRYANVLVSEQVLPRYHAGRPVPNAISAAALAPTRSIDRYAVILRDGPGGSILAARYL